MLRQQLQAKDANVARLQKEADDVCKIAVDRHAHDLSVLKALHKETEQQTRERFAEEIAEIHSKHEEQVMLALCDKATLVSLAACCYHNEPQDSTALVCSREFMQAWQ